MTVIYKIIAHDLWRQYVGAVEFPGSPVDLQDGFIHFSTAAQVRETAVRHFHGQDDLVLLAINADVLPLRWEPSRGGDLFPHLYAPLPLDAVLGLEPLSLGADGIPVIPDEVSGA
jgi:uncharacterized protein (DUF952 family)